MSDADSIMHRIRTAKPGAKVRRYLDVAVKRRAEAK